MPIDSGISTQQLAALIVDALVDAEMIAKSDFDDAFKLVAEEIEARKAVADYWCNSCPN